MHHGLPWCGSACGGHGTAGLRNLRFAWPWRRWCKGGSWLKPWRVRRHEGQRPRASILECGVVKGCTAFELVPPLETPRIGPPAGRNETFGATKYKDCLSVRHPTVRSKRRIHAPESGAGRCFHRTPGPGRWRPTHPRRRHQVGNKRSHPSLLSRVPGVFKRLTLWPWGAREGGIVRIRGEDHRGQPSER